MNTLKLRLKYTKRKWFVNNTQKERITIIKNKTLLYD